jgi:hypothetical protein
MTRRLVRGHSFGQAFRLANGMLAKLRTGGTTRPLAEWLEFGPQLTRYQQCKVAGLLRLIPDKRRYGDRGPNREPRARRRQAKYQVAREVIERQQTWYEENPVAGKPAKRVPWTVTKTFIEEGIGATSPLREDWQNADAASRFDMVEQIKLLLKNREAGCESCATTAEKNRTLAHSRQKVLPLLASSFFRATLRLVKLITWTNLYDQTNHRIQATRRARRSDRSPHRAQRRAAAR